MRLSTELQDSEVFRNFMEIAEKENMMGKKAELLYPDYDITASSPELDIPLRVTAGEHDKLYHVHNEKGEDLVNAAHPGGGTQTQLDTKPEGKLGFVETIVEQHKVLEDIARGTPTGKIASLSERLVRLADKFEDAGFEMIAASLTDTLDALSAITHERTVVAATGDADMEASIKAGNMATQQILNQIRAQRGLPALKEDGIMGRETRGALTELGIQPGSYKTWGELYTMLGNAGQATPAAPAAPAAPMAPAALGPGPKPADVNMQGMRSELEKGMPAPVGKSMHPPQGLNAADGKLTEAARSTDLEMMLQEACDAPELNAEDDVGVLRQQAMEDAKRRLQEAELQTALKGVKPTSAVQPGLAPRTLPAPGTGTFHLNKVRTPGTPDDTAFPTRQDRVVPKQPTSDVRELELTPGQYQNMQNK